MNKVKLRVYLLSFGWYLQDDHNTLAEAQAAAQKSGFECRIDSYDYDYDRKDADPLCTWSPISGWRFFPRDVLV